MAKEFVSYVDEDINTAIPDAFPSRKRTRSQTKKAGLHTLEPAAREPLGNKANGVTHCEVKRKTRKLRESAGSAQEKDAKRPCVVKNKKALGDRKQVGKNRLVSTSKSYRNAHENGAAELQRRDAAIADINSFVALNPEALTDDYIHAASEAISSAVVAYQPSKAALFFQTACEDIMDRISAAVQLEECPKVILVNTAWAAKLKPRLVEYAPTRRILHNLMKRQVIVDAGFLHDIMQDSGNSAGLTLRMHMILIDWLVDVAVEFHLGDATLALTAQIIGRFLSVETVEKRELQLLGVTAMWIASKMEEVSVPLVSDFAWITYDTYTTAELRIMERRVLRALQFRLSCVTPWTLVHTVLELPSLSGNIDMKHVTGFLHDLAIHDPAFSTEAPGEVAAAIVYAALRAVLPAEEASKFEESGVLEYLLKCQRSGSKALLEAIVQLPQKARQMEHKLSAVLLKFRKEQNGTIADRIFRDRSSDE